MRPLKTCSRCGGEWDLEACYRKNPDNRRASALARAVCVMCELTERNDPTPRERAKRKAQNSIITHAEKHGMAPSKFAKQYGWNIERMIYDVLHGHENTCPYCYEPYQAMGHGLSDITLDVVDPKLEPYYHTNVRWCCATCNREKSQMSPLLWAIRCTAWSIWQRRIEEITKDQTYGLPLFEDRNLLM